MAVPCPADTPNDLHEQLSHDGTRLKIKLRTRLTGQTGTYARHQSQRSLNVGRRREVAR